MQNHLPTLSEWSALQGEQDFRRLPEDLQKTGRLLMQRMRARGKSADHIRKKFRCGMNFCHDIIRHISLPNSAIRPSTLTLFVIQYAEAEDSDERRALLYRAKAQGARQADLAAIADTTAYRVGQIMGEPRGWEAMTCARTRATALQIFYDCGLREKY